MPDNRQPWEIIISIRVQNAIRYLKLLELNSAKRVSYEQIFKTGDLETWAKNHARSQVSLANQIAELHPVEYVVPSVEKRYTGSLAALGLLGLANPAAGLRTE